jgi:hypothetical protein
VRHSKKYSPVGLNFPSFGSISKKREAVRVLVGGDQIFAARVERETARNFSAGGHYGSFSKVPFCGSISNQVMLSWPRLEA